MGSNILGLCGCVPWFSLAFVSEPIFPHHMVEWEGGRWSGEQPRGGCQEGTALSRWEGGVFCRPEHLFAIFVFGVGVTSLVLKQDAGGVLA